MVEVLFFARIREQLGVDRLSVPLPETLPSVASLINQLVAGHGGIWQEVLSASNVVKAVNQQVVDVEHILNDGDEVAFFPPVTGG